MFRRPGDSAISVFRGDSHSHNNTANFLAAEPDAPVARTVHLQEIARLAHNPPCEWLTILHAAALADPLTNKAVILPAATNSGKSTLTAALASSHGKLRFLSDDSAAITTSNEILSLPFALMLREGSWPVLAPYLPELATTGVSHRFGEPIRFLAPPPATTIASAVPEALVFVNYQPAGVTAKLHHLNNLQTFYLLQKSGFWIPRHNRNAIANFRGMGPLNLASLRRLQYSDLSEGLCLIQNLLGIPGVIVVETVITPLRPTLLPVE